MTIEDPDYKSCYKYQLSDIVMKAPKLEATYDNTQ